MPRSITTWYSELIRAIKKNDDVLIRAQPPLGTTMWDEEFDPGFGSTNGQPFTAWGRDRVYFPLSYDGAEWIGSAPRNPSFEKLSHQGGG